MFSHLSADETKNSARNLRQKAYHQIKHEIITCAIAPGEQVSEISIAERFQISKTPVREALTLLQKENLVEYRPNKGFSVTSITLKDIHEIFEARIMMESALLRLAVKFITEAELQELETYLEILFDLNQPDSVERYIQSNTDFHLCIARAARNSRLYWHYSQLLDEAQRLIYMDLKNTNILNIWHRSHQRFIDALRNRDPQAAVIAVEEIMENGKKRILGL